MLARKELLDRLVDHEDSFVERKPEGEDLKRTIVAFANSVPLGREAVIYVGIGNDGKVLGVNNTDSLQKKIHKFCRDQAYPPIQFTTEILRIENKPILAVVIPPSPVKPHFAAPGYIRRGSESIVASPELFNELITSRTAKAAELLRYMHQVVTVFTQKGRLGAYRSGDRSEYLAGYALSRIAFVNPFPRQEEFGVADFLCVLSRREGPLVFPEAAFYVQVKSTADDWILEADNLRWISEYMDHPLLICVADKQTARIKLYSCWPLWRVVFPRLKAKKVTIILGGEVPNTEEPVDSDGHVKLNFGPPIMEQSLDEIEANPDFCHALLKEWLHFDGQNIARRRVGRIAITGVIRWRTNKLLSEFGEAIHSYWYDADYRLSEKDLAPILTALAHNYRHDKQTDKLDSLCRFLATIEDHLDDHGKEFARGQLRVDGDV